MRPLLVVLMLVGAIETAIAGSLAPSKVSDLVTLSSGGLPNPCATFGSCEAMNARPTVGGSTVTPFNVPQGQVLIVTDVDFTSCRAPSTAGQEIGYSLDKIVGGQLVTLAQDGAVADAAGCVNTVSRLGPVATITAGETLCMCEGAFSVLHGFLAPLR